MQHTPATANHRLAPAWAFLLALAVLLQGLAMARTTPWGNPPDEWAHVSYIDDVASAHGVLPDYRHGVIRHSYLPNYLDHPFLYYAILGKASAWMGAPPFEHIARLRQANAVAVGIAFLLCLLAALRAGVDMATCAVTTLACCATPMYAYLSGSVNNDNLAALSVAMAITGAWRWWRQGEAASCGTFAWIAAGLAITMLTKATATAYLVFFLAIMALARPGLVRAAWQIPRVRFLAIAVVLCAGSYYGWMIATHGVPFPRPAPTWNGPPPAHAMGLMHFAAAYLVAMLSALPDIASHGSVVALSGLGRIAFFIMWACVLVAWLAARPWRASGWRGGTAPVTVAMLALLATACLHVAMMYVLYRRHGVMAGVQPRYYAYLLPWLPLMAWQGAAAHGRRYVLPIAAVAGMLAFWASVPRIALLQPPALEATYAGGALAGPARPGLRGAVEVLTIDQGVLHVTGWALDDATSMPPPAIVVEADGHNLAVAPTELRRDDLDGGAVPGISRAGFAVWATGLAPSVRTCDIQVHAMRNDGTTWALRHASCVAAP